MHTYRSTLFLHTSRNFTEGKENVDFYHPSIFLLKNEAEIIHLLLEKLSSNSKDYGQMGSVGKPKTKQNKTNPQTKEQPITCCR